MNKRNYYKVIAGCLKWDMTLSVYGESSLAEYNGQLILRRKSDAIGEYYTLIQGSKNFIIRSLEELWYRNLDQLLEKIDETIIKS